MLADPGAAAARAVGFGRAASCVATKIALLWSSTSSESATPSPSPAPSMDAAKVAELKAFVAQIQGKPELLHLPQQHAQG